MANLLSMNAEAARLISSLGLAPLPHEGGFFRRTWTAKPVAAGGKSPASTILFLITDNDFSALHALKIDEIWSFHAGDAAELVTIDPATGSLCVHLLGPNPPEGDLPHIAVPAGHWQGARLRPGKGQVHGWALFGCTTVPGWDEGVFELGSREGLLAKFPAGAEWIKALTRG
jgi:hypothetical protein